MTCDANLDDPMIRAMKMLIVTTLLSITATSSPRAVVGHATLAVAGRSNATVSLASGGGLVVAAWSAATPAGVTDVYSAVSADGGLSFSAPLRVNTVPGDARVNGEQPPRITIATRPNALPVMTLVWTSKDTQGTTILSAQSEDGGRTFGRSTLVPGASAPGNRGWENAAADLDGRTRVVWLDHREMVARENRGASHQHAGHDATSTTVDGVAMAQKSKLYLATVGSSAPARTIAAGVCYCCKTAIASGLDGALYLAWRHVYPGNLRDIAFTMSRDGGRSFSAPLRVSEDRWQIDGCPDDGPAMSIDGAKRIHLVWPSLVSDGPGGQPSIGVFYTQSSNGQTFSSRLRLKTEGLAHHPQVIANGSRLFVAWDELKDGRRRIVVAERSIDGNASAFTRTVVAEGVGLLYPALTPSGTGALVAWTAGSDRSTIQLARVQ